MGSLTDENIIENVDAPTYAPSLPVPNVQEIVKKDPLNVPERYVRNQEDRPQMNDMSHLSSKIPVIDLSLLSAGDIEELNKLDLACKEWGFFQVVNHGMAKEVLQNMKNATCSVSTITGMDKYAFLGLHNELQALRINYYPACCRPDHVLGISPHSDTSTITILMQEDINGLQIKHSNGGWVPVKPVADALVVNVGDVIEILSNGKYKSVEHRAVTDENKKRISYASFICPLDDVEIGPLEHLLDSQNPQKMYKKVRYGDYLRSSMKRKLEGKAHIEMAKVEA